MVGSSLTIGPGAVEVHRHRRVVHVARGVGRVVSLVLVPLRVPVVTGGVLLEVLAGSVIELAVLEELVGHLASSSGQGFEDLLRFGHVDCRVPV